MFSQFWMETYLHWIDTLKLLGCKVVTQTVHIFCRRLSFVLYRIIWLIVNGKEVHLCYRVDLRWQFSSSTSQRGLIMVSRSTQRLCWHFTRSSVVVTRAHLARQSYTAVLELVVREHSLRWTTCLTRRQPRAGSTCMDVCVRWGTAVSTWSRQWLLLPVFHLFYSTH